MQMATPSKKDLEMALELAAALESLCGTWGAFIPQAIEVIEDGLDCEMFYPDNAEQCGRVFEYLRELVSRGSLFRVVMGMAVLCDPKNKVLDPDADHLALHPEIVAALKAANAHNEPPEF